MLAITYIPVEEIDDLFALYREKKLHVSISLSNVWNYSKPFAEWTAAEFDRIKRIEAYMHEQLSN